MNRLGGIGKLIIAPLLLYGTSSQAQSIQASSQLEIWKQVVELRAELTEYLIADQKGKIAALTRQLDKVRQERKRAQDDEQIRAQQISQAEQQLSSPELHQQERPQLEAVRAQLVAEEGDRLRSEQDTLAHKESELSQQLEGETQRGQTLELRDRKLRAFLRAQ